MEALAGHEIAYVHDLIEHGHNKHVFPHFLKAIGQPDSLPDATQ